jgi:vitamin B12 transporter
MNLPFLVFALIAQQPRDTVTMKPVVVTATRVAVPADLVASPVTVLRGVDLEARGIRTVAEALREVPGAAIVETGSFGGQTALFLRGGENDYVKVLIDGVPLNQPGGGLDFAHITTDNVDRIEIVRGPTSVLYGSDAVTGVIQIFTRAGSGPLKMGADVQGGSYGSNRVGFDMSGGTTRLGYGVRASRFGADGLYPINNQYRNGVVSGHVRLVPDDRTEVNLAYRYGDALYHFPTDGSGQPSDSNQRSAERGPLGSVIVRRRFGAMELSTQVTLRETRQLFNNEPDSPGEDGSFWSNDFVRRAAGGALVTWRPRTATALSAGVDYEDERQRGRSEFSASFGDFPDSIRVQRSTAGYYAQAVFDAFPFAITVGGRLDENSTFHTHGTYRIGLVFHPRGETRLRFSAGTGFKEPTFFENFSRLIGAMGNPDLKPERSTSWEAGIDRTLAGGRVSLGATYFDQRFYDLIDYNGSVAVGQSNYFNVPGATSRGVEVEISDVLTPAFGVVLRYTYLRARASRAGSDTSRDALFVPGEPLLRRPTYTVAPEIDMTPGRRTRLTFGARAVGRRDDLDFSRPAGNRRVTLAPYAHLNFAAEYTFGAVQLSGRVENLLNDQAPELAGFRPRGRTFSLGCRVAFER